MSVCDGCIGSDKRMIFVEGHPAPYKGIVCRITGATYARTYNYIKPARREGMPPPFPDTCEYAPALKAVVDDKSKMLVAVPKGMMNDKWLRCLPCEFFTPEAGCVTSEDCPYDCPLEVEKRCYTCNLRVGYEESVNWCGISEGRPEGNTCTGWEPR